MPTVLMLSANPKGTTPLRLDEELREVKEGLIKRSKLRDSFSLVSEHAVRTRDVQRALLDHQPNILHFSGHGTGAQGLLLEDESGGGQEVSGEAIAQLLGLFKESLQCVVLNACYSEVQAKAISEHIPFVIGMSDEIGDKAAMRFTMRSALVGILNSPLTLPPSLLSWQALTRPMYLFSWAKNLNQSR